MSEQPTTEAGAPATTEAAGEAPKLSNAELKKRQKEEKQKRRAAEKAARGETPAESGPQANGAPSGDVKGGKQGAQPSQQGKPKQSQQQHQQQQKGQGQQKVGGHERKPSGGGSAQMPIRARRGSQGQQQKEPVKKQDSKVVELFSHLYSQRRHNIDGASKDVHPSVIALGFQISSYEITGSSARCVGMLNAFKDAIQEYTTPGGKSLARHMPSQYLSPQIDYLKSCRPISESMGNAIRWLKKLIVEIDPNTPEHEAKDFLCDSIDKFIQERIMATDQVIAGSASSQIKNGSVVLTYAKSSIVEKTILRAHAAGTNFRVICIDSRPLFEGKKLATSLMYAGLQVEYLPFSGIARAVADATVVLLGAHSMLSNGRLQSRIGTASVAMAAHRADIPVIVCCESVKFSGKVALDSIVLNEVAPAEELLLPAATTPAPTLAPKGEEAEESKLRTLNEWKDVPNLQILNLMYDVTPAEYIRMVICEYGSVPPSSVPVVHRLANEGE